MLRIEKNSLISSTILLSASASDITGGASLSASSSELSAEPLLVLSSSSTGFNHRSCDFLRWGSVVPPDPGSTLVFLLDDWPGFEPVSETGFAPWPGVVPAFELELTLVRIESRFAAPFLPALTLLRPLTTEANLLGLPGFERSPALDGGRGVDPSAGDRPLACCSRPSPPPRPRPRREPPRGKVGVRFVVSFSA